MRSDEVPDDRRGRGGGRFANRDRTGSAYNPEDDDNAEHPLNRSASGNPQDYAGPTRTNRRGRNRYQPYGQRDAEDETQAWSHDMFEDGGYSRNGGGGGVQITIGNRGGGGGKPSITVTGLESDVTEQDLEDIFGSCGTIKTIELSYDKNGNSRGKAEITFSSAEEAATAVKEYDGAEVDGKSMTVVQQGGGEVSRTRVVKKKSGMTVSAGFGGRSVEVQEVRRGRGSFNYQPRRGRGNFGGPRRNGGGARNGGGGGRKERGGKGGKGGRGGKPKEKAPSQEDLDADMDSYFAAAKKDEE
jgi:THO complex subunit 4